MCNDSAVADEQNALQRPLDEQVTMGWVLHRLQALAAPLPVHPAEDIVPLLRSLPKG